MTALLDIIYHWQFPRVTMMSRSRRAGPACQCSGHSAWAAGRLPLLPVNLNRASDTVTALRHDLPGLARPARPGNSELNARKALISISQVAPIIMA